MNNQLQLKCPACEHIFDAPEDIWKAICPQCGTKRVSWEDPPFQIIIDPIYRLKNCPECDGMGYRVKAGDIGGGLQSLHIHCHNCGGSGIDPRSGGYPDFNKKHCPVCGGDHTKR